jgi:hypothetical protein
MLQTTQQYLSGTNGFTACCHDICIVCRSGIKVLVWTADCNLLHTSYIKVHDISLFYNMWCIIDTNVFESLHVVTCSMFQQLYYWAMWLSLVTCVKGCVWFKSWLEPDYLDWGFVFSLFQGKCCNITLNWSQVFPFSLSSICFVLLSEHSA